MAITISAMTASYTTTRDSPFSAVACCDAGKSGDLLVEVDHESVFRM